MLKFNEAYLENGCILKLFRLLGYALVAEFLACSQLAVARAFGRWIDIRRKKIDTEREKNNKDRSIYSDKEKTVQKIEKN